MRNLFPIAWLPALAASLCAAGLLVCGTAPLAAQEADHGAAEAPGSDEHAHEHAEGHHNEFDLTHANASEQLTAAEEVRFDLAISTLVVFLLLLAILWKFAWGPIVTALENRERAISDQIEEARLNNERAAELLRQHEAQLAAASEQVREMMAEARRDADAAKERILSEAQQAAERERQRAVSDISIAKDLALREIAQKSVDTAVALAGRIVRKEINPQDHAQLIKESLEKFPSNHN